MLDINIAQIVFGFIVLLFSLTVHEMAHAWTADRLGDSTARERGRISLNPLVHADPIGTVVFPILAAVSGIPLIGWAKPVPVMISRLRRGRRDYVIVAAAGPLSNLTLAVLAAVALRVAPVTPVALGQMNVSAPLAALLGRATQVNVLLAVFNLMPIPPLDGGNVLGGMLPARAAARFDVLRPYGLYVLYALMLTGGLYYVMAPPYQLLVSWLL